MITEHGSHDTSELAWFKSSYSDSHGGDCVEVATCSHAVHVRDSKNQHGPQLAFTSQQWDTFVAGVLAR